MTRTLLIITALACAIGLTSCGHATSAVNRLRIEAAPEPQLMHAVLVAVVGAGPRKDVRYYPGLQKESRELFAGWIRTHINAVVSDTIHVTFYGPIMSGGQRACVDYPEMRTYMKYIEAPPGH